MTLRSLSLGRTLVPESTRDFDHSIYYPAALQETATAYAEILDVKLDAQDGATHATFNDEGMVVDAFCNHALFLSIQAHRDAEQSS